MDEQPMKPTIEVPPPEAVPTVGEAGHQFGFPHIKAACPKCFVPFAVSGPGKFVCRNCGTLLDVTAKAE